MSTTSTRPSPLKSPRMPLAVPGLGAADVQLEAVFPGPVDTGGSATCHCRLRLRAMDAIVVDKVVRRISCGVIDLDAFATVVQTAGKLAGDPTRFHGGYAAENASRFLTTRIWTCSESVSRR